jgi:hypothetical protein
MQFFVFLFYFISEYCITWFQNSHTNIVSAATWVAIRGNQPGAAHVQSCEYPKMPKNNTTGN